MPRIGNVPSLVASLYFVMGMILSIRAQVLGPSVPLEDFDRELGPFEIKGQRFTLVLHMKRVQAQGAVADPEFQETLARLEFKDAQGVVHYENALPVPDVAESRFVETTRAQARILQGKQGTGLLLSYLTLPSTPLGGASYQVLGLINSKLVPFSKPVFLEGDLMNDDLVMIERDGDDLIRALEEPGVQGDMVTFRVWTGNFFVIVPLKVDWLLGKFAPAWQCRKMTARGWQPLCQVRVEAERVPQEEDLTFVRLHQEPEEGFGTPAHVVVKKDSQVEFLAAETEVNWNEETNGVGLGVSDDVWLKVRIDGKEGWIHTQEDFMAIGLPQAG